MTRKRILVADASETIIAVCRKMLTQHGYEASLFQDGTKALEELKRSHYDLAVIATTTQSVDGYFIIRELRKSPAKAKLPVLMLLGSSELLDTGDLVELAPNDTLNKPFSPQELLAKINNLLAKSEPDEETAGDGLDIESILTEEGDTFEKKIASATDKIFLGVLAQNAADASQENRPRLDKLELSEDQYDLESASSEIEPESAGPHDYDWFVSEMRSDSAVAAPEIKPVRPTGQPGKFEIEEIGTSKISPDQLKKMQSAGEAEKTKVYIEKLHEPFADDTAQEPLRSQRALPDDLRTQFIKYFAEYLAKEVAKQIDFAKLATRIESEAVKLGKD
jgi:DNA-binding response OmpR family regulator